MSTGFQIGVAVGSGLAARVAERAGADFLLAINAGRMRNMGAPSVAGMLPITDATEITESFANSEVLSQSQVPVFKGVDVFSSNFDVHGTAARAADQGFQGVVNFPTSIHLPVSLQRTLDGIGRGFASEIATLKSAQDRGLRALAYCADRAQAELAAKSGLNMILLNFGWNAGGALGHKAWLTLEEAALHTREIGRMVKRLNPGANFLLEGGPIVSAEDLGRLVEMTEFDGYVGGSTIERLPLENAVADLIASYRLAAHRQPDGSKARTRLLQWGERLGTVGTSDTLVGVLQQLDMLSKMKTPVLIQHEPGTDIEWVLKAFETHAKSSAIHVEHRGDGQPLGLIARRLFGSVREGVTRGGLLSDPDCKLIVLQDPARLSPRTQLRLARALKSGRFEAPGTRRKLSITARFIFLWPGMSGALPSLDHLSPEFAEILSAQILAVPPLRDRPEDIEPLFRFHLKRMGRAPKDHPAFRPAALQLLRRQEWPGNDRQLLSFIEAFALWKGKISEADLLEFFEREGRDDGGAREKTHSEKDKIIEALWRNNFHRTRTAAALGVSRKTLYNKMQHYGLGT